MVKVDKKEIVYSQQVFRWWFMFSMMAVICLAFLIFVNVAETVFSAKEKLAVNILLVVTPLILLPFALVYTFIRNNAIKDAEKIVKITNFHTSLFKGLLAEIDGKEVMVIHQAPPIVINSFVNDYDELEVLVTKKGKYYLLNPKTREKNKKKNAKKVK